MEKARQELYENSERKSFAKYVQNIHNENEIVKYDL